MDSGSPIRRHGEHSKLFDPCDPGYGILLFTCWRCIDYFRRAGKWENSSRRYGRSHGRLQEGENVHVYRGRTGVTGLGYCYYPVDLCFWNGRHEQQLAIL